MKWNFPTFLWIGLLALLLCAAYRERNTYPLRWSGYAPGAHPIAGMLVIAGLAVWLILWVRQRK